MTALFSATQEPLGHQVTATDAKAHLARLLRAVEDGEMVVITRHGQAVAVMVPAQDAALLQRLRKGGPQAGLFGLAGGWEGSEDLANILQDQQRGVAHHRSLSLDPCEP